MSRLHQYLEMIAADNVKTLLYDVGAQSDEKTTMTIYKNPSDSELTQILKLQRAMPEIDFMDEKDVKVVIDFKKDILYAFPMFGEHASVARRFKLKVYLAGYLDFGRRDLMLQKNNEYDKKTYDYGPLHCIDRWNHFTITIDKIPYREEEPKDLPGKKREGIFRKIAGKL